MNTTQQHECLVQVFRGALPEKTHYGAACLVDDALCILGDAMVKHPEMIAGTDGLCSLLTGYLAPKGLAKVGADGVYCAGFLSGGRSYGLGLKIADGNYEASEFAVVSILGQLGSLNNNLPESLSKFRFKKNLNEHKKPVGEYVLTCKESFSAF